MNFVLPESKDGKDSPIPSIKINEIKTGKIPLVENIGDDLNLVLDITLPEAIHGKDGITPIKGIDFTDGKDGSNGKAGRSSTIEIGNVILGETLQITNRGTKHDVLLDFVIPKAKDGVDGYVPQKDIDYRDGIDGINGTTPIIKIGKIVEGITANVVNSGDDNNLLLDFTLPKAKEGKKGSSGKDGLNGLDGKDGINGIDGKDGKDGINGLNGKDGQQGLDGVDGKNGINGIDGIDGKDGKDGEQGIKGDIPNHEIDSKGNIRFELPDNTFGEWVQIPRLIESTTKQFLNKIPKQDMFGGGGSNLDVVYDGTLIPGKKYLDFDVNTFDVVNTSADILKIYSKYEPKSYSYKVDTFIIDANNKDYKCSESIQQNSESVILNGVTLKKGIDNDYIILSDNKTIVFSNSIELPTSSHLIIKYLQQLALAYASKEMLTFAEQNFIIIPSIRTYTCSSSIETNSEVVILNGITLRPGIQADYTISANKTIVINNNILLKDSYELFIKYIRVLTLNYFNQDFIISTSQLTYSVANTILPNSEIIALNGVVLSYGIEFDYIIDNKTIIINNSVNLQNDWVLFIKYHSLI